VAKPVEHLHSRAEARLQGRWCGEAWYGRELSGLIIGEWLLDTPAAAAICP
jgi:hypothetical protein